MDAKLTPEQAINLLRQAWTGDNSELKFIDMDKIAALIESLAADAKSEGVKLIADERQRQIEKEGWTSEHDKQHENGELALAAACYAIPDNKRSWISGAISKVKSDVINKFWPWGLTWWKPTPDNRIRELTKAGALIAAEIDRLRAGKGGE